MILCIDGSDIATLALEAYERKDMALSGGGWQRTREAIFDASPEEHLACITQFVDFAEIEGIAAVQGPGSATALRASLAIANTLAMTRKISLYGVQKGTSWEEVFTADGPKDGVSYLEPVYAHDPRITPSTKDALRRKGRKTS